MKKAWKWITEHWQVLLGALSAMVVGWLAWGAYERKVGKLKDAVKVEHAIGKIAKLETKRKVIQEKEKHAEEKDKQIAKEITKTQKEAIKVREEVETRSADEIAARFNQLYR